MKIVKKLLSACKDYFPIQWPTIPMHFNVYEIQKTEEKLKPGKARGLDSIFELKTATGTFSLEMLNVFNYMFALQHFLIAWKRAPKGELAIDQFTMIDTAKGLWTPNKKKTWVRAREEDQQWML